MKSKFESIKNKVAQATISIAVLHSPHNHITILSLFKTDYYYSFLYTFRCFVFLVCLFPCLFTFFSESIKPKVMHFCVSISGASVD